MAVGLVSCATRNPRPNSEPSGSGDVNLCADRRSYVDVVAVDKSWASSAGTRASMRANRGRDTRPELAVRRAAHALGLRYRVSVRPVPTLRRTADLVFTRAKIAVFVDGCFWHGCPEHHTVAGTNADFWASKVTGNRERDAETNRLLQEAGWTTLRFWEHEDPKAVAHTVHQKVRACR